MIFEITLLYFYFYYEDEKLSHVIFLVLFKIFPIIF